MEHSELRVLVEELRSLKSEGLSKLILDDNDLMEILKVSKRTLATYRSDGLISYSKVYGRIYYSWDDVQEFIKNHHVQASQYKRA